MPVFGDPEEKAHTRAPEVRRAAATETTAPDKPALTVDCHHLLDLPQEMHEQQTVRV